MRSLLYALILYYGGHIPAVMVGMQQVMGLFAQGSCEVFLIQRQHVGVLVGEAELIVGVQPPKDAAALIRQLAAVYDGLSAAASAAAGAGHYLNKVVMHLAALDSLNKLARIAEAAGHGYPRPRRVFRIRIPSSRPCRGRI